MGIEALVGAAIFSSVAGAGLQVYGGMKASESAQEIASLEKQQLEQQKKQMALQYQRQQMEMFRNQQKARAMGLVAATSQGVSLGSSSVGIGMGNAVSQGLNNALALNQNYAIGKNMGELNSLISDERINMAEAQGIASFGQGMTSLGNSLMSSVPAYGRITGQNANLSGGSGYKTPFFGLV